MKVLYITTIGATMRFFADFIDQLKKNGHQVDIACGEIESVPKKYYDMNCHIYKLSCSRSPINAGNIKAIKEIRRLVKKEKYDIVHCHTPLAAVVTRIACKNLRTL